MNLIRFDAVASKPFVEQLAAKYPYLEKQRNGYLINKRPFLQDIIQQGIDYRLTADKINRFAASIIKIYKDSITNIDTILFNDLLLPCDIALYQIYCDHRIEDFKIIGWATDFYGKSIDEFAKDAMTSFCNYGHHDVFFYLVRNRELCDKFIHIVKCELLITLGILFQHIQMMIILEYFRMDTVSTICQNIICQIKEKGNYNYAELMDHFFDHNTQSGILHKLRCLKKDNPDADEDIFKARLKRIYNMYYKAVIHIDSLQHNPEKLHEYIEENLDIKTLLIDTMDDDYVARLLGDLHCLLIIPSLITHHNNDTFEFTLKPIHLENISLQIEI